MENASPNIDGCMSKEDKVKLNGIASGANNYTLPTASASTLGGIKTGYNSSLAGYGFPIELDDEGNAATNIEGLFTLGGNLRSICFRSEFTETIYGTNNITRTNANNGGERTISFPEKSGTLALLSDIPDFYSLCKFNFVNSINECITGTINLLFVSASLTIDLSDLDNFEDGVIIFLAKINGGANAYVNHTSGYWFSDGVKRNEEYRRAIPPSASIVTVRNGTVYVLI